MKETAVRMLLVLFFFFYRLGVVTGHGPHAINITAEPGQNVTLSCPVADYQSVTGVEWSKKDLHGDVLLFHNGKIDLSNQNPSFKNRVYQQMKDGNISLILTVKPGDNGTYECRLERQSFEHKPNCTFQLDVASPGENDGRKEDGGKEDGRKEEGGKEDGRKEDGGEKNGEEKNGESIEVLVQKPPQQLDGPPNRKLWFLSLQRFHQHSWCLQS
ncbi:uncharacterized protein LOC118560217 [Fundulus heteroclitus]|uniref:uncharacterized protein LOC118560217 n=1 Tax=Fundulus heteroclitus TaxID=8078 RepID=UPI00165CCF62|nr:uncharacterized protein LOC118560217 [Fundulus heteroclitus]